MGTGNFFPLPVGNRMPCMVTGCADGAVFTWLPDVDQDEIPTQRIEKTPPPKGG